MTDQITEAYARAALNHALTSSAVDSWFDTPHRYLNCTPRRAMELGRHDEVVAAAHATATRYDS